jgi:acetyl esterase/lipase
MIYLLLIGFVLTCIQSNAGEFPTTVPTFEVRLTEGIIYGVAEVNAPNIGSKDLLLDLYEPIHSETETSPAVLIIHGGAFEFGSRNQTTLVHIANDLASRGYVVASIDYRLAPDEPIPSSRVEALLSLVPPGTDISAILAAIDDALTALDWFYEQSSALNIDTDRLGLLGGSAGAVTAIHLAYALDAYDISTPELAFVVDFWGANLIPPGNIELAANQLETGEAPLFVVHGTEDETVLIEHSVFLVNRAVQQGVPVEFHPRLGAGHSFNEIDIFTDEVTPGITIAERMYDWLKETITYVVSADIEGSWVNPDTTGEGFMFDFEPTPGTVFATWVTYGLDALAPLDPLPVDIGVPGQRWLTSLLSFDDNIATGTIYASQGGAFNTPRKPDEESVPVGDLTIEWLACDLARVTFEILPANISGTFDIVPLKKIVRSDIFACK